MAAEEFKTLDPNNENGLREKTKEISTTFLDAASSLEINVPYELKKQFERAKENPDIHTFDNMQQSIFTLMLLDCYPKFKDTIKRSRDETCN